MRILYFHQHFSTPRGAVGIRSYEMARRLLSHGHQVTMVCGSYSGADTGLSQEFIRGMREGVVDEIKVIEFNLTYSNSDGFFKRVVTFLRFAYRSTSLAFLENYDVLFATSTPLTASIPGVLARWLRQKPFVFEVRDLWPELPRAMGVIRNPLLLWAMGLLEWLSYRSAHRLIGLSPGIVQGISNSGVARDCIAMIPNGCDLEIFGGNVNLWRPEGVKSSDFLALFAGTHGIANNLNIVLDVAAELKHRGRDDIKIALIGQGKLKGKLRSRANREALDNVIFGDPVNKASLAGLMASADIGLQVLANVPAFYYGTSPNKFFDYIAAGLPVLTNYPGWLADIILERKCGHVVPPDDPLLFADALEELAADRRLLKRMGANSLLLAQKQFDRGDLADQWVSWVTGVVG